MISEKEQKKRSILNISRVFSRIINKWYLLVISLIFFFLASLVYIKYFTTPIYEVDALIDITNKNSGVFASESTINFIWGNNFAKINSLEELLKSRTLNEILVKENGFFTTYEEYVPAIGFFGKEKKVEKDVSEIPFRVSIDYLHQQTINKNFLIEVEPGKDFYFLSTHNSNKGSFYNYITEKTNGINENFISLTKTKFYFGKWISSNGFRFRIEKNDTANLDNNSNTFLFGLSSINNSLKYRQKIIVTKGDANSNVVKISLNGTNKKIIINYLNTIINQLIKSQLRQKNTIPNNTIAFIEDELSSVKRNLDNTSNDLKNLRERENIIELSTQGSSILGNINTLENQNAIFNTKLGILKQVQSDINSGNMEGIVALSTIETGSDQSVFNNIKTLRDLSLEKANLLTIYQPNALPIKEMNEKINLVKGQLQGITSNFINTIDAQKKGVQRDMSNYYQQVKLIPLKEQKFVYASRDNDLNNYLYTELLRKLAESKLIRAANVSDVDVIDYAKEYDGQAPILPKTRNIKLIFLLIGLFLPLIALVILELLDNKIKQIKDLKELTNIPLIGVVPKNQSLTDLIVLQNPKSIIAEGFRMVMSNIKFLSDKTSKEKNITIVCTSSVSGEGKTFSSISLASIYSISGKKTILVGLDLRKPRIADDFNLKNDVGVSNYLADDEIEFRSIIKPSGYKNLDIILSGSIPPNPYELITSSKFETFINQLKNEYEVVILDTPPLNLIADTSDIIKFADVNLYVVRQDFSRNNFLMNINELYDNKELKNIGILFNDSIKKTGYGYRYGSYGYGNNEQVENGNFARIKEIIKEVVDRFKSR